MQLLEQDEIALISAYCNDRNSAARERLTSYLLTAYSQDLREWFWRNRNCFSSDSEDVVQDFLIYLICEEKICRCTRKLKSFLWTVFWRFAINQWRGISERIADDDATAYQGLENPTETEGHARNGRRKIVPIKAWRPESIHAKDSEEERPEVTEPLTRGERESQDRQTISIAGREFTVAHLQELTDSALDQLYESNIDFGVIIEGIYFLGLDDCEIQPLLTFDSRKSDKQESRNVQINAAYRKRKERANRAWRVCLQRFIRNRFTTELTLSEIEEFLQVLREHAERRTPPDSYTKES